MAGRRRLAGVQMCPNLRLAGRGQARLEGGREETAAVTWRQHTRWPLSTSA